jgi:hypothetical protein
VAVDGTSHLQHYNLLIGGANVPAATGETFDTLSPTTNEPVRAWERRVWKTSMPRRRPQGVRRGTVAANDAAGAVARHAQDRFAPARSNA